MKVACLADLHGNLPNIQKMPESDIVVIAGDLCPATIDCQNTEDQLNWLAGEFAPWARCLKQGVKRKVYYTPGNHDWCFEVQQSRCFTIMNYCALCLMGNENLHVVSGTEMYTLYGYPWTPRFLDWAFNSSSNACKRHAEMIPEHTDILVTHGPPLGTLDISGDGSRSGMPPKRCGCKHLRKRVYKCNPKLHVFGHIHGSYGQVKRDNTIFVNASYVNEAYTPRGEEAIQVVEI